MHDVNCFSGHSMRGKQTAGFLAIHVTRSTLSELQFQALNTNIWLRTQLLLLFK